MTTKTKVSASLHIDPLMLPLQLAHMGKRCTDITFRRAKDGFWDVEATTVYGAKVGASGGVLAQALAALLEELRHVV